MLYGFPLIFKLQRTIYCVNMQNISNLFDVISPYPLVDEDVYHIGASLKDLGKRLFAFDKMGLSKDLILSQVR